MFWETQGGAIVATVVYSAIGIVMFAVAFVIIERLTPFSVRKELEDDDNIAVGIVLATIVIGISMIISAALGD